MKKFMLISALLALLMPMTAPALAGPVTLTGTVSYSERITLPPDAILRVALVERGTGDVVVAAQTNIPDNGKPPLRFALNIHSDIDVFGGRYGIHAEINSGHLVLLQNSPPYPIATEAAQSINIVTASIAAPPSTMPETDSSPVHPALAPDFVNTVWTATSIGGHPVIGSRPITLSVAADQRSGGFGGCNNYFAEALILDDSITFGPAAATRMACSPEIMAQEAAYFAALAAVASFEHDRQGLRLLDGAGIALIGYVVAKE